MITLPSCALTHPVSKTVTYSTFPLGTSQEIFICKLMRNYKHLGFLRGNFIWAADVCPMKRPSSMMFTCMTHFMTTVM